ncbi:hypothetical protein GCM10007079_51770 [Nocardiopsis terrae]|uniref:Uncharacterized protein n=1 Tax=Nocardiopsis terrae TaxID=372655 RepID=A0ABR9HAV1_9ACTN|nr:DUF2637 domain-containing protein [Nocardiopsis terrae]MBE1456152.1 hypothetical protein [Nocardiopsis terrae]GHC97905.1 hypothetical protein GCM10007079_51770 [Nocardiopsis terrae]
MFVSVIALCALVLAYHGIYQFARVVHGGDSLLAHVFPVTFTLLVLMAFWVSYVLRSAPPGDRLWVDLVLIPLLVLAAAVPMVLYSRGLVDGIAADHRGIVEVVVAVAPLAALLVAFLLWMAVRAHIRRRNTTARPRPQPSDDRTTVLRDRTGARTEGPDPEEAARDDRDPETLKSRLLRLGSDDDDRTGPGRPEESEENEERAEGQTAPPLPARTSTLRRDRAEQEEGERREREDLEQAEREREEREAAEERERAEQAERAERERTSAEAGSVDRVERTGDPEGPDEPSVPALPLPRRSRDGGNPIKRAAEEPPVVPGAAAPAPEEAFTPEPGIGTGSAPDPRTERFAVVPEHLADEGFEHDSPVADPSTDEAEAPVPAPPAAEPPGVPEPAPAPVAGAEPTDPGETVSEEAVSWRTWPETSAEDEPEADPAPGADPGSGNRVTPDEPEAEPLWEPPSDDGVPSALADYVPPVWTPPEDDGPVEPASPAERVSETSAEGTPALDHDTGPDVRAAFRFDAVPPGAAAPEPEPLPEPEQLPAQDLEPEPVPEPERAAGREAFPEPEHEPVAEPTARARPEPRQPVEKRPMVLKPKRPPLSDFASGPPSRRVRSEPLPPDER